MFFVVFVPVHNSKYQNIMIVTPSETSPGSFNLKCNKMLVKSLFLPNF